MICARIQVDSHTLPKPLGLYGIDVGLSCKEDHQFIATKSINLLGTHLYSGVFPEMFVGGWGANFGKIGGYPLENIFAPFVNSIMVSLVNFLDFVNFCPFFSNVRFFFFFVVVVGGWGEV